MLAALANSRASENRPRRRMPQHAPAGENVTPAQSRALAALRKRLGEIGVTVMPSLADEGSVVAANAGQKINLSLIMSLLQQAGVQDDEVQALAPQLHAQLAALDDPLGEMLSAGQPVHKHGKEFEALALHVFGACGWRAAPKVLIVKARERGATLLYDPMKDQGRAEVDPATISHDTAVLIESPGGFEALANTSGRPWSSVLAQLRTCTYGSEKARSAAWLRHRVRAVHAVELKCPEYTHEWKQGMQEQLQPPNVDAQASAITRAQAIAGAQAAVDKFWARAKVFAVDHGHRSVTDRYRIHSMAVPLSAGYEDETNDQYVAQVHVLDDWIIGLTLSSFADGNIVIVDYEDPRYRPAAQSEDRQPLWHLDDVHAFDRLATAGQPTPPDCLRHFAEFLRDLREYGRGMGWDEFRWRPHKEVDEYLSQAMAERGLRKNVLSVVRQMIERQRKELHRDDQKAYEAFLAVAATHGRAQHYANVFAALLRHQRVNEQGMVWEKLCLLSDSDREFYLHDVRRNGGPYPASIAIVARLAVHQLRNARP